MENKNKINLREILSENVSTLKDMSKLTQTSFICDNDDFTRLQIINCNYMQRMRKLSKKLDESQASNFDNGMLYDSSIGHAVGLAQIYNNLKEYGTNKRVLDYISNLALMPFKYNQKLGKKLNNDELELLNPEYEGKFKNIIEELEENENYFNHRFNGISDFERYIINGCIEDIYSPLNQDSRKPLYLNRKINDNDWLNSNHLVKNGIFRSKDFLI